MPQGNHLSGPEVVEMLLDEAYKIWTKKRSDNSYRIIARLQDILIFWVTVYRDVLNERR